MAFIILAILQHPVADGLPIYLLWIAFTLGALFLLGFATLAEALKAGEHDAVGWTHLVRALLPPGILLGLGYLLTVFGLNVRPAILLPAITPFLTWRGKEFIRHPYAQARIFFTLWRCHAPPEIPIHGPAKHGE